MSSPSLPYRYAAIARATTFYDRSPAVNQRRSRIGALLGGQLETGRHFSKPHCGTGHWALFRRGSRMEGVDW